MVNFNYIGKLGVFLFCLAVTTITIAGPYAFTYTDTLGGSSSGQFIVGEPIAVTIVLDNGGTSAVSQTWTSADIISMTWSMNNAPNTVVIEYSSVVLSSSVGSFVTDAGGALTAVPSSWIDNFNPTSSTILSTNYTGLPAFWIDGLPGSVYGGTAGNVAFISNTPNDYISPAFWSITIVPIPDIEVTMTESTDPVTAGSAANNLTHVVTAKNITANPATGIEVSLTSMIPVGTSLVSATGSGTTSFAGTIWTIGALGGNASETLTLVYTVGSSTTDGSSVANSATLSAITEIDDDNANDTGAVSTSVVVDADLSMTLSDSPDPVIAGNNLTYTVTVNNTGPSDATDVSVVESLPTEVALVSTTGCAEDPFGTPNCSLGTITSGSSAQYTVIVNVDSATLGSITNSATVSTSTTESNSGNNTAMSMTAVITEADLSITKTDNTTTATPGISLTYTIVASNAGPSDDPLVSVTDTFPADLTCSFTSLAAGGATVNTNSTVNIADTLSMPSGSSVTYTAVCDIDAAATGTLSNTATIMGSVNDPVAANNTATDNDTVLSAEADLSITKTDNTTTATPGTSLTYTIVASNAGPSDDPLVSVTDTFPADLTCSFTSLAAGGATVNTNSTVNIADTLSMPSGSSVTYTAVCDIDAAATGTLSNTATISGSATDSVAGNNTVTDADTVLVPEADLSIVMTPPPANITTPDIFTYVIDVTNAGPSDATNVVVTDALSVGYFSVETVGCVEDPNGYQDCTLGNLAPGEMASYSISFSLGSVDGEISNTATVISDATDAVANNSAVSVIFGTVRIIPIINQWGLMLLLLLVLTLAYHHSRSKNWV